jgi:hypothetical protein
MSFDMLLHFFGWCAVINYAVLIFWLILHYIVHGFLAGVSKRLFGIDRQRYDELSFSGMMYYKLAIILTSIVPFLALLIVR